MLSNYTSNMPMNRLFDGITKMLVSHGARQIMFEYGDQGQATGITFVLQMAKGMQPVKLPARVEKVEQVFKNQNIRYKEDQPYRTGWKNIYDWIKAQLALLDTEMVKMEEIFLPYMVNNQGKTLFEAMEKTGFYLPSGEDLGE